MAIRYFWRPVSASRTDMKPSWLPVAKRRPLLVIARTLRSERASGSRRAMRPFSRSRNRMYPSRPAVMSCLPSGEKCNTSSCGRLAGICCNSFISGDKSWLSAMVEMLSGSSSSKLPLSFPLSGFQIRMRRSAPSDTNDWPSGLHASPITGYANISMPCAANANCINSGISCGRGIVCSCFPVCRSHTNRSP